MVGAAMVAGGVAWEVEVAAGKVDSMVLSVRSRDAGGDSTSSGRSPVHAEPMRLAASRKASPRDEELGENEKQLGDTDA